jgi:site-specific recombinase XerD
MQRFIALRRLAGTDYHGQAVLLGYFDRFLVESYPVVVRLTREITDQYERSLMRLASRSRGNRLCVVRQFCKYLARTDALSYVPDSSRSLSSRDAHAPYIYGIIQIRSLLNAASNLPPPGSLRPETYRTLLGLLYSTGIRIGEACALTLENFHRDDQRLYIAAGKFHKSRWVVLSKSACTAIQQYVDQRIRRRPRALDSPLFLNERGRPLRHVTVYATFRHLLEQSGIPYHKTSGPRIHDLRHTFAVHRLLEWYRDGADINSRLPWLTTYMGHVNLQSTQVYLHATPELIEHVDRRFHQYYLQHIQPLKGTES